MLSLDSKLIKLLVNLCRISGSGVGTLVFLSNIHATKTCFLKDMAPDSTLMGIAMRKPGFDKISG